MHPDADRSQLAGNTDPPRPYGPRALIGGALGVFAVAAIVVGAAVMSREGEETSTFGESRSKLSDESLATSTQNERHVESMMAMSVELAALRRDFEAERAARLALAKRLSSLNAQLGLADPEVSATDTIPARRRTDTPATKPSVSAAPGESSTSHANREPVGDSQDQPWFNRAALERAGISSSEIDEIVERWERHEMDKLYLDDQRNRDGTFKTGDYNREVAELNGELREDLGTEGYDAYLYATGQFNRIVVRQVLENSPAGRAGLEAGDEVIRYSGERVFLPRDLKQATSSRELGTQIYLELLRDGRILRLSVPSGPLGISLKPIRATPLGDW